MTKVREKWLICLPLKSFSFESKKQIVKKIKNYNTKQKMSYTCTLQKKRIIPHKLLQNIIVNNLHIYDTKNKNNVNIM